MDESRKAFEQWFKSDYHPDKTGPYIKDILFFAWKASRSAIEIKLPTENELHQKVCSGCASEGLEMVEKAIRAAGIKVKE